MNEFMKEFFPKDSATDLMAVIKSYKLLLENMPPGQKEPIIIIGALLEKGHVAAFTFEFQSPHVYSNSFFLYFSISLCR